MTKEEFAKLPLLLTRKKFHEATGLCDRDIDALVKEGKIAVFHRPSRTYGKQTAQTSYRLYPKSEAARIAMLPL